MRRPYVGVGVNSQQMYSFVGKIQGSEQIAVLPMFCLYQYSLGSDVVEVFVLIVIENTAVDKQSKAY